MNLVMFEANKSQRIYDPEHNYNLYGFSALGGSAYCINFASGPTEESLGEAAQSVGGNYQFMITKGFITKEFCDIVMQTLESMIVSAKVTEVSKEALKDLSQ